MNPQSQILPPEQDPIYCLAQLFRPPITFYDVRRDDSNMLSDAELGVVTEVCLTILGALPRSVSSGILILYGQRHHYPPRKIFSASITNSRSNATSTNPYAYEGVNTLIMRRLSMLAESAPMDIRQSSITKEPMPVRVLYLHNAYAITLCGSEGGFVAGLCSDLDTQENSLDYAEYILLALAHTLCALSPKDITLQRSLQEIKDERILHVSKPDRFTEYFEQLHRLFNLNALPAIQAWRETTHEDRPRIFFDI